jgi:hypothetical protein
MKFVRFNAVVTGFIASAMVIGGCGDDGGPEATATTSDTEAVGTLEGTDAYVGLVAAADGAVMVYVCDGDTISEWFRGDATGDSVSLTSSGGATLRATLADRTAAGSVTLADGTEHSFSLSLAAGDAGLYRSREETADGSGVGGWIVLADGSARGGLTVNTVFTPLTSLTRNALKVTSSRDAPWF